MFELSINAIADLMQKHRNELLRFLSYRLNNVEDAQDVMQETFIRYAGYSAKASIENPKSFMFRIANNLATDHLRSRIRQPSSDSTAADEIEEWIFTEISTEQIVMSQQQLTRLAAALAELPPKCRDVFILLRIKHHSYADVEKMLGISQTMILKYLQRAMCHCRQRLEEED